MEQLQKDANNKLAKKLVWLVVGSLAFAFALVPIYNVFCDYSGLNGKTENKATSNYSALKIDESRLITVQFVSTVMPGLGWNFYPKQTMVKVHPGQIENVIFEVKNTTNEIVVGRAVPSVTPGKAVNYLKKIACFCFVKQTLKPGESKELPLRFFVSNDIPEDVNEFTLSYSFFPVTN